MGQGKTLINISALLSALVGTSPDIPIVRCTQSNCGPPNFAEISARHRAFNVGASLTAPHPENPRAARGGKRIALSDQIFENYTVVASALVAESGRRARPKPGCPRRACRFKSCRAHFVVSSVRDGTGRRAGFRLRCPRQGVQVRLLPDVPNVRRAVGEIVYHSWLLPMSSGFKSRAAHPQTPAPLAELG